MVSDLDIFRSAHALVKQHGQDAPIEAAVRAVEELRSPVPQRERKFWLTQILHVYYTPKSPKIGHV